MTPAGARPAARCNFRFSPRGTHAVCLLADPDSGAVGGFRVERWTFGPGGTAGTRVLGTVTGSPFALQPSVDDTGAVLLCRSDGAGRHELIRFGDDPDDAPDRWATVEAAGFSLSAAPGLAVSYTEPVSTVWRLGPGREICRIAEVDGLVAGGLPLDPAGRLVGYNHRGVDRSVRPLALDTGTGTSRELVPGHDGLHLLASRPETGRVLLATAVAGETRLATATVEPAGGRTVPRDAARIDGPVGTVRPLALDAAGTGAYLVETRGVRSHLLHCTLDTGTFREIRLPLGVLAGSAVSTVDGLRFPFTTPTMPYAVVTAPDDPAAGRGVRIAQPTGTAAGSRWTPARVERYQLRGGSVEALVYGPDWRTAPRVLVALHGGPDSAWQAEFDPVLQELVAAGCTVIAPNQRGSTGYGPDHQQAINHAWGGPDLADVTQLADHVAARRAPADQQLLLLGISYGAFLALLAAATRPDRWSHCVAVSPFMSGRWLYQDATAPVRRLVHRLGGMTDVDDRLGPRDLAVLAGAVRAHTLLVQGRDDDIIPVDHVRRLYERLFAAGGCRSLRYVEVPDAGHAPLSGPAGPRLVAEVCAFLVPAAGPSGYPIVRSTGRINEPETAERR